MPLRDKGAFLKHLADCFARLVPEDVNPQSWVRRQALDMGMSYDTFANHFCGKHQPFALELLLYFEHFGPQFEAMVRGHQSYRGESISYSRLMDFLERERQGKIS